MKRRIYRGLLSLIGLCLLLAVSGCGFSFSPEELYSLPQLPAEYTELNNCINQVIESGAEYAAPVSGSNIQSVQLEDLNGDGEEEAVAFFRNTADEKPLKIYIFTAGKQGYEQAAVIEGTGTSIYSIAYEDLDQDGRKELLVGWRVNTDLQALSVYTLRSGVPEELIRGTNYVRYAVNDLNQDDLWELVELRRIATGLMERIQSNYRFVIGFNGALIGLGVLGLLPPATSAMLHNLSTLAVSLHSMSALPISKPDQRS